MNENERIIAGNALEDEKLSDETLLVVQKMMADLEKLDAKDKEAENSSEDNFDSAVKPKEDIVDEIANETEIVEDVATKKEKLLSKESKYRKLQNDKYRALAEKEEALRKVEELEKLLNDSLDSGTYHYSKSAYADLDRAKQDKKMAIENGDIDALIEADIALTEAIGTVSDLKKWSTQDKRTVESHIRPKVESNYDEIKQEIANDWLDNHSYLQPNSRDYNVTLAKEVSTFVTQLDNELKRSDQLDLYFSNDYFDTIDEFINSNVNKSYLQNNKSQVSTNHIGGVRHGHSPSVNGVGQTSNKVQLTADEKIWCQTSGLPEIELIRKKIEFQKKGI